MSDRIKNVDPAEEQARILEGITEEVGYWFHEEEVPAYVIANCLNRCAQIWERVSQGDEDPPGRDMRNTNPNLDIGPTLFHVETEEDIGKYLERTDTVESLPRRGKQLVDCDTSEITRKVDRASSVQQNIVMEDGLG